MNDGHDDESSNNDPLKPSRALINPTLGSFSVVRVSQIQQVHVQPHTAAQLEVNRQRIEQLLLLVC